MKRLTFLILVLAVSWTLSACGGADKPKPPPEVSTWDSAVWNQSTWEK
jgi:hypothetical protein